MRQPLAVRLEEAVQQLLVAGGALHPVQRRPGRLQSVSAHTIRTTDPLDVRDPEPVRLADLLQLALWQVVAVLEHVRVTAAVTRGVPLDRVAPLDVVPEIDQALTDLLDAEPVRLPVGAEIAEPDRPFRVGSSLSPGDQRGVARGAVPAEIGPTAHPDHLAGAEARPHESSPWAPQVIGHLDAVLAGVALVGDGLHRQSPHRAREDRGADAASSVMPAPTADTASTSTTVAGSASTDERTASDGVDGGCAGPSHEALSCHHVGPKTRVVPRSSSITCSARIAPNESQSKQPQYGSQVSHPLSRHTVHP